MTHNVFLIVIALIFSIFQGFVIISFFRQKLHHYLSENITIYIAMVVFLYCESNFRLHLHSYIILLVIITTFGHSFIGEYLDVYYKSKIYDRFLHFFGSLSFSLFAYSIIRNIINPINYSRLYVSLFVTTLGISLGVLLEIAEFIQDMISKTRNQHGLKDTNFDLIADVLGAILAGILSTIIFI